MPAFFPPPIIHGSNNVELIKRNIEQRIIENCITAIPLGPGKVVFEPAGGQPADLEGGNTILAVSCWITPARGKPARRSGDPVFEKAVWNEAVLSVLIRRKVQQQVDASVNALRALENYVTDAFLDRTVEIRDYDSAGTPITGYARFREPNRVYIGAEPGERGIEKVRIDFDFRWIGFYRDGRTAGTGAPVGGGIGTAP